MSKILVVDDNVKECELLKRFLESKGYEVVIATDGMVALTMVRENPPQLVILDIFMPKLDGHHLCRLLKYDKMFKDIPIIIVSAGRKETDKQLGIACGGDEYVTKPYDMNNLLNLIENYLR